MQFPTCAVCQSSLVIRDEDKALLLKLRPTVGERIFDLPEPTLCPLCRKKRRLIWRNVRSLWNTTCAATGENILSMIPPDKGISVYKQAYWWSDAWDAKTYGRDFDFSRPFCDQFRELLWTVPACNLVNDDPSLENSTYVNGCSFTKNCYLIFNTDYAEDSCFNDSCYKIRDAFDNLRLYEGELCYETTDCRNCYQVLYADNSENCSHSLFLSNCRDCKHCFGCVGLEHKEYCVFNVQFTKEAYETEMRKINLGSYAAMEKTQQNVRAFMLQFPLSKEHILFCENSTGNYLRHTKNVHECFDAVELEDSAYCSDINSGPARDCMDYDVWGNNAELIFQSICVGQNARNVAFTCSSWENISNILYSASCFMSTDLFGCVGIKKGKYCVLNKQYTKEQYEELVPRIIAHMESTGEWGQFFPPELSFWEYDISLAGELHPLTREQALREGLPFNNSTPGIPSSLHTTPPDSITDTTVAVLQEIYSCDTCKKPYKIVAQELAFYIRLGVALPHTCHNCRHLRRRRSR